MDSVSSADAAGLAALTDRAALQELLHAYCRGVDRRDYALLSTLYHPDARDDHGGLFRGSAADYIAWLPGMLARFASTSHYIHNAEFRIEGDRAEGQSSVVAHHLTHPPDPVDVVMGGRYLDRFERRDGRWRFSYRFALLDWATPWSADTDAPMGRADETDPSYAVLSLFSRGG